jgi:hypothetical protein
MPRYLILLIVISISGIFYSVQAQNVKSATFVNGPRPEQNELIVKLDKKLVLNGDDEAQFTGPVALEVTDASGNETSVAVRNVEVGTPANTLILNDFQPLAAVQTAVAFELKIDGLKIKNETGKEISFDLAASGDVVDAPTDKINKLKVQQVAVDAAQPTDNKTFFTGFNFASSDKGGSEGNAELITNIKIDRISPNLFVTLNLKKSSKEDADPKQFNFGLAFRRAFTNPFLNSENGERPTLERIRSMQKKRYLLGVLTEVAARVEGEALNFNTTNAVVDIMPFQILSRVKRLGTRNLFMKFHLIPVGFEFGRNLRSENETVNKYYISRFKAGGEIGFVYEPRKQENSPLFKRAEFNFRGVYRHLFREETSFDQETGEASGISKGGKTYSQIDFKVFFTNTSAGRFGFKVSRIKGPLPPTFNDTNAFTYGLVFESAEDKQP